MPDRPDPIEAENAGSFDFMVTIHHENKTWWAESDAVPGWSAAADTRELLARQIIVSMDELRPGARWHWTVIEDA